MGCQGQKCSICGGSFPACQMKDGKCASCRAKEKTVPQPAPKK